MNRENVDIYMVDYYSVLQKQNHGAGEMAQQLKALTAVPEDTGWIPSTMRRWLTGQFTSVWNSSSRGQMPSSGLTGLQAHTSLAG